MLHFHKLIYINELGQVKCNLVRGWGSVGYIMCGCGSKQTRGKQTRRLNRERSAGIMTGQDVIVLSYHQPGCCPEMKKNDYNDYNAESRLLGSILFPSNILYLNSDSEKTKKKLKLAYKRKKVFSGCCLFHKISSAIFFKMLCGNVVNACYLDINGQFWTFK